MPRFRKLAGLVLVLVLVPSWAAAAPRHETRFPAFSPAETFFSYLWSRLAGAWAKIGCISDPDGQCAKSSGTKIGCIIDPSGSPCSGNP